MRIIHANIRVPTLLASVVSLVIFQLIIFRGVSMMLLSFLMGDYNWVSVYSLEIYQLFKLLLNGIK